MQTVPRTAQLGDLNGNEAKSRKKIDPTRFHVMLVVSLFWPITICDSDEPINTKILQPIRSRTIEFKTMRRKLIALVDS